MPTLPLLLRQDFAVRIHGRRKVELLEHFDEKVFVKQELENLSIIDIATSQRVEVRKFGQAPVPRTVFQAESAIDADGFAISKTALTFLPGTISGAADRVDAPSFICLPRRAENVHYVPAQGGVCLDLCR